MPRNATCRSSGGCVANGNVNQDDEEANNNNNTSSCSGAGGGDGIVKQELEAAPPVCHRKSERRRVARDIFLVFEEQSTRRRGKGARGKNTRAKQKFGHLKVANTPRISKSVLREIKTEPKCSTGAELSPPEPAAAATPAAAPIPIPTLNPNPAPVNPTVQPVPVRTAAVKLEAKTTGTATTTVTASNVVTPRRVTPKPKAPPAEEEEEEEQQHQHQHQEVSPAGPLPFSTPSSTPNPTPNPTPSSSASAAATPSVNPIFLWVKQDDTRIVEVRCEDYDKRNRIRLTKTTNGWRSMPRTDASSTRIVKFFHGSAAPLMKVKREQHQHHHQHQRHEDDEQEEEEQQHLEQHEVEQEPEQQQPQMPVIAQNLLQDWEDSVTQLPDEIEEEDEEEEEATAAEELQLEAEHTEQPNGHLIENVVLLPSGQEQQTCPSRTPCFDGLLDSEETNASTKATKTNTPTYQSSTPSPLELQLCPKTGLFLPKGDLALIQVPDDEDAIPVTEEDKPLATAVHDPAESLDANTKNLKDLLDDADDLLQNCSSDHGSSGADLLDSLVKRSCEDNLVQQETSTGSSGGGNNPQNTSTSSSNGDELSSFCVPDLGKDLPSILNMDNDDDAPKCLSFNEAGEIEGLNGELFLGIEAFDKQQEAVEAEPEPQPPTPATVELTQTPTPTTPTPDKEKEKEKEKDKDTASGGVDETPKDLSYKKREEVCPPSESRSQCAVTSSSDILKSPERDLQLPANSIPAEVETTSETIKNLILEQFLKLNNSNSNPQQAEPMDLGKAGREGKLETVVIDDEDEEEEDSSQPLKKRPKASIKMDKDPDALTQLKMLISNPQWKVPDPILVPKDRLGAVLASPAREIPLLLTTRPELRLPEAFAYPEIIQNPNILVVTMEQLEAILKTEAEQAAKATKEPDPVIQLVPSSKPRSPSPKQSQPKPVPPQPKPAAAAPVAPTPPSPAADSSLSTDLNATTLALLQQMLWLPYFGQLSQEFFKTIKDPLGLQRKFMSNLLPLYNSQFGLQHLDELYKQCMKQKPAEEQQQQQPKVPTPAPPAPPPPAAVAHAHAPPSAASVSTNAFNGFTNPVELVIMQKLLQPQLPQFLNWGEAATKEASSSSSATASSHHHHQEHKRPRREPETAPETICNFTKSKSSAAAAAPAAVPTPAAPAAAPAPAPTEHKPRLTIKSLSNLLEPEANVVPLLNVPFDGMRGGRSSMHKSLPDQGKETGVGGRTLRSSKACVTYNPLEQAKQQVQQHSTGVGAQQQQRKRGNMLAQDVQLQQQQHQQHLAEAAAAGAAGMDANSALWHPLFGSNPKQGYNSPWQWTTVTATGE